MRKDVGTASSCWGSRISPRRLGRSNLLIHAFDWLVAASLVPRIYLHYSPVLIAIRTLFYAATLPEAYSKPKLLSADLERCDMGIIIH